MMTLAELAQALGADLRGRGDVTFDRVDTDSRQSGQGGLFVALKGERFDGHAFAEAAVAGGAAAALVERGRDWPHAFDRVEVDDTLAALGRLGACWRDRFALPLVAITGSNGKTSVKDMLATILRRHAGDAAVLATSGNLNNHIGLPLMLTRLGAQHRYGVLEMGMNHFGEIAYLARLARPRVALINNAGAGHLEFLGSIEGVARAKGEIFDGLDAAGIAIVNADDAYADYWRALAAPRRVLDFGLGGASVTALDLHADALSSRFVLRLPDASVPVTLEVPGLHNVRNALAAAAAAYALGLDAEAIAAGLADYAGTRSRLQLKRAFNGARLIDDTYNANPNSMRAAIDVLAAQTAPRVLALGDMGEVGTDSDCLHAEIGAYARHAGIEYLYATGAGMRHAVDAFGEGARWFGDHAALATALRAALGPAASVLVKGSRFMRMERVVDALASAADPAAKEV